MPIFRVGDQVKLVDGSVAQGNDLPLMGSTGKIILDNSEEDDWGDKEFSLIRVHWNEPIFWNESLNREKKILSGYLHAKRFILIQPKPKLSKDIEIDILEDIIF